MTVKTMQSADVKELLEKVAGFNQDGIVVIEFKRTFMVYKRGQVPTNVRVQPPKMKG